MVELFEFLEVKKESKKLMVAVIILISFFVYINQSNSVRHLIQEKDIPVLIFSAGLADVIEEVTLSRLLAVEIFLCSLMFPV